MKIRSKEHILLLSVALVVISVTSVGVFVPNAFAQSDTTNNSDTKVSIQTYENLSEVFGTPLFLETSHKRLGSITVNSDPIQTQDSYSATGILKGVWNVTDVATFITTHFGDGKSTSIGKGNFTTKDGEIVNYTGQDVGLTDNKGIETYKGIQIFRTSPEGKLGFLDNAVGLYIYRYWSNGTTLGTIWQWK